MFTMIQFAYKYWPIPTMMGVFAQSGDGVMSSSENLTRLFDVGAVGVILAIMLWQQYSRESRLAKEVYEREDRMAVRINNLEERDHKNLVLLTDHNKQLQEFIQEKLLHIMEQQTANVNSCHNWRNEARAKLFKETSEEQHNA